MDAKKFDTKCFIYQKSLREAQTIFKATSWYLNTLKYVYYNVDLEQCASNTGIACLLLW